MIYSMLLNSMSIIILKYAEENVAYHNLGLLEFFKDIPIAIFSIISIGVINRIGNKVSLMISLSIVFLCCIALPLVGQFWFFKVWFSVIGISFAIGKISVFAILRNNSDDEKSLSKSMNSVEASYMIGLFAVNMGFGIILGSSFHEEWKYGFWLIAVLAFITFLLLFKRDYDEIINKEEYYSLNIDKSIFTSRNMIFFMILFLIVFAEQGYNSWLPTFYKKNLNINSFFALQSAAFLSLFSFIGRTVTSRLISKFKWSHYVTFCLAGIAIILMISQTLLLNLKGNLWFLLYFIPLLGLFLSPLYPLYNSKFLYKISKEKVNSIISFIMLFSSFGSSFGSLAMAFIFQKSLDSYFMLFSLIPIVFVSILTYFSYKKHLE